MDSTSLTKPVDLQGLSLALAKTKADYMAYVDAATADYMAYVDAATAGIGVVFETTLSYNEATDVISSNKTYAEIVAAYNSGKTCIAMMNGVIYGLSQIVAVDNDQDQVPFVMFTGLLDGAGHIIIRIYNTGEIEHSQEGAFLENFNNVQIGIPQDGQVLQYDATNNTWINATLPTGVTETRVNELIAAALAQYGDGDTATYGYNDASEVNY